MSFLLHASIKVTKVDISGDPLSSDNYAVLWLQNADWDKYQTSRPVSSSPPVELFLHNVTNIIMEIKDTRALLKDKSYGKITLELFDSKTGKLLYPELKETTVTAKLKRKHRKSKGKVDLVLFLHQVYSCSQSPRTDPSKIHYPFKNLVLEGGGVRGIAYGGCIEMLEKRGILDHLVRICGTSAGAIAALLLCLGANSARIRSTLEKMDFAAFKDGNIISNMGLSLHTGKALSQTIKKLIEEYLLEAKVTLEKLNKFNLPPIQSLSKATFAHLNFLHQENPTVFRQYFAIGTKLSPNLSNPEQLFEMVVFSYEKYPQLPLWKATRISMGLPFYFKPIILDGIPHVDGGLLYNYAINVFDKGEVANPETLGMRVDKPDEIARFMDQKLESVGVQFRQKYGRLPSFDEFSDWIKSNIQNTLSVYQTTRTDDGRSVYINTGSIGTTEFELKKEQREGLIEYGKAWSETFFSWWDNAYLKNPTPTGPLEEAGKLKTQPGDNHNRAQVENQFPGNQPMNNYPNQCPVNQPMNSFPNQCPVNQPMNNFNNQNMGQMNMGPKNMCPTNMGPSCMCPGPNCYAMNSYPNEMFPCPVPNTYPAQNQFHA